MSLKRTALELPCTKGNDGCQDPYLTDQSDVLSNSFGTDSAKTIESILTLSPVRKAVIYKKELLKDDHSSKTIAIL